MTHDELFNLTEDLARELSGTYPLYKALRAVVELHKPSENDSWGSIVCVTCPTWEYPCPTIQQIIENLE